jgi:hypothetical protein
MTDTLRRLVRRAAALALLAALCLTTAARQTPVARDRERPKPKKVRAGLSEAQERAARERLEAAALILEVADGAGEVEDADARAALLAEAADALWTADEASARLLFRRAWRAATEADESEAEKVEEEQRAPKKPDDAERSSLRLYERREVLGVVARRDRQLAEEFIAELRAWVEKRDDTAADERADGDPSGRPNSARCRPGTVEVQRFEVATSLLADGAHEAAADIAAPLVRCGADAAFVLFLYRLRSQTAARADVLFLNLLEVIRADPSADAGAVLDAAAYVAPPGLLMTIDEWGRVRLLDLGRDAAQAESPSVTLPRRVREAFYNTAAAVLLRARRPTTDAAVGNASLYFAINRLLPFFERESPRHAPALHARRAALAAEIEPARRANLEQQASARRIASRNHTDPLRPFLDSIEQTANSWDRDRQRLRAAHAAARRRLWERARQLARAIEDAEMRRSALRIVGAYQVVTLREAYTEVGEDDVASAAGFVRAADLPPGLKAVGLTQAAMLAEARGERARALELVSEALDQAAGAEEPYGVVAALLTAEHAARLDSPRVWEAVAAAVSAVNAAQERADFASETDATPGMRSEQEAETLREIFDGCSLEAVFKVVAPKDFTRSLAEVRSVKNHLMRSHLLVAAARSVIERRNPAKNGAR